MDGRPKAGEERAGAKPGKAEGRRRQVRFLRDGCFSRRRETLRAFKELKRARALRFLEAVPGLALQGGRVPKGTSTAVPESTCLSTGKRP